jgi:hypothetical protein
MPGVHTVAFDEALEITHRGMVKLTKTRQTDPQDVALES